jgi:hypothetical protein
VAAAAVTASVTAGFAVYLRLAQTRAVNSDGAAQALQAWDMLHGNLLLHGWTTSDVPFYTTEVPEYLIIEAVRGLGQDVVHVAAALTYTLVVLLAALLAAGRGAGRGAGQEAGRGAGRVAGQEAGQGAGRGAGRPARPPARREALTRAAIAAGIMLTPQLGSGTNVLLSSPDHIGTSVPLLAVWLILDRARPRWSVPVVASALLAWAQVADSIVLIAGVLPLAAVCAFRLCRPAVDRPPPARDPARRASPRSRWYTAALGGGALLSAGVAELVLRLLHAAGGFGVRPLGTQLAPASEILGHNLPVAGQCLLLLTGADFFGQPGGATAPFVWLHLAGALLAAAAIALAAGRFGRLDLVSQVLTAAIAVSIAAFVVTSRVYGVSSAREIAPVLPFAAALTGRLLAGPLPRSARAAGDTSAAGTAGRMAAARRMLLPALGVIGAGYLAGLGVELAAPAAPPQAAQLTAWLERHPLGNGLSGYWESSVVTLTSGGRVAVRPVTVDGGRVVPALGEVRADWFDPARSAAHYVVLFPGVAGYPGFTDRKAVLATFGRPARAYQVGRYTIWYWPGNVLPAFGAHPASVGATAG